MEIWFLKDMPRLSREREAIESLQDTALWLGGINWVIEKQLCLDAVISVHGNEYSVRLVYPDFFPFVPPTVYPSNPNERWSSHQYNDGALCLEWGPDTWHPDITAAQVLESVSKLLHIENPLGNNHEVAPSRHHLSASQILRYQYGRFLLTSGLIKYLSNAPIGAKGSFEFVVQWQSKSMVALIQKVEVIDTDTSWENILLPEGVRGSRVKQTLKFGLFYKTQLDTKTVRAVTSPKELRQLLYLVDCFERDWEGELYKGLFGILLLDACNCLHFFLLFNSNNEHQLLSLLPVQLEENPVNYRISTELNKLSEKSVGIVGLGSAGSKIASSLARTGVSSFFLVDDDIFLPENVCRNALDWRNVGEHKVDAVAGMISCIGANVNIDVAWVNLTGQESNISLDRVLKKLSKCDLLIDATANPKVFNLLAAIAKNYIKPLVWIEVFAGGIGGMIARSRPGEDPEPQLMRTAYHNYLASLDTEYNDFIISDYTLENQEGKAILATDAEVSIIAYHVARFATDILQRRQPSVFPYSMYLIGLAQSWIFKAPFNTIPIATDHLEIQETTTVSNEVISDNLDFLTKILDK